MRYALALWIALAGGVPSGWASVTSVAGQSPASTCSTAEMDRLRAAAQGLAPESDDLAEKLQACPELKDEARLWQAFYHRIRGEYEQGSRASSELAPGSAERERDQLLSQATQGDPGPLEGKVRAGAPGYGKDAESILVLARSQARVHRFADAYREYDDYLALKPDDTDIRIEAAYTHLWGDDPDRALQDFEAIRKKGGLTPEQDRAAENGIELARKARARLRARTGGEAFGHSGRSIPFTVERGWSSYQNFARTSVMSGWVGPEATLGIATHSLVSDLGSYRAYEATAARSFSLPSDWAIYGRLGIFSGPKGILLGTLAVSRELESGLTAFAGVDQDALARSIALPTNAMGYTLDSIYLGFRYERLLEYRFSWIDVTDQGPYTRHSALGRIPLHEDDEAGSELDLTLRGEYESHSQYSPLIYSPASATLIQPGLEYQAKLGKKLRLDAAFGYGVVFENLLPAQVAAQSGLALGSTADAIHAAASLEGDLADDLLGRLSINTDRTLGQDNVTTYQAGVLQASLSWYYDQKSVAKSAESAPATSAPTGTGIAPVSPTLPASYYETSRDWAPPSNASNRDWAPPSNASNRDWAPPSNASNRDWAPPGNPPKGSL